MKNLGIKSAAVSVTMAVLTGAILLGVHVASGVDAPAQSPSTAGNVGPTFSGVKISGSSNPDPDDDVTVLSTSNRGTPHSSRESLNVRTQHGYVDIGPKNTTWSHFYTSASNYFFDKRVYVDGGKFASLNGNLELQTTTGGDPVNTITRMTIDNANGNVGIGTATPGAKLDVAGDGKFSGDISVTGETTIDSSEDTTHTAVSGNLRITNSSDATKWLGIDVNEIQSVGQPLYINGTSGQTVSIGFNDGGSGTDYPANLVVTGSVGIATGMMVVGLTYLESLGVSGEAILPSIKTALIQNPLGAGVVKVDDQLDVTGYLVNTSSNNGGDFYVNDSLNIVGAIKANGNIESIDGDIIIDGGSIKNPNTTGTTFVKIDDDLGITGNLHNGLSGSPLVVSDSSGLDVRNGIVNNDTSEGVTVNDDMNVTGTFTTDGAVGIKGNLNNGGSSNNGGSLYVSDDDGLSVANHLKAGSIGAYYNTYTYRIIHDDTHETIYTPCDSGDVVISCGMRGEYLGSEIPYTCSGLSSEECFLNGSSTSVIRNKTLYPDMNSNRCMYQGYNDGGDWHVIHTVALCFDPAG